MFKPKISELITALIGFVCSGYLIFIGKQFLAKTNPLEKIVVYIVFGISILIGLWWMVVLITDI